VAHRLVGIYQPNLAAAIGRATIGCRRVRFDSRDRLDLPIGP
jgi:hypothetical protein